MAIISNFELLAKPIAPQAGPAAEIARVAIQGYFLEISNLENRDISLLFRTKTPVRQAADSVNTEFTDNNHVVVYDITQDNIFATTMISGGELIAGSQLGHYILSLNIPAGQTASLAVLPNVQNLLQAPGNPAPDLAIRGYTELVLKSTLETIFPEITFSAPESARILISAEHRGTFVDPLFDPTYPGTQVNLDFDQASYSLIPANGQALQNINTHANFNDPFQDLLTSDFISNDLRISRFALSELGNTLSERANSPARSTSFKLGSVPVEINYSIKNGKYVVEKEGLNKAVDLLIRRRKLNLEEVLSENPKIQKMGIVNSINTALGGDKDAEAAVQKFFNMLLKN